MTPPKAKFSTWRPGPAASWTQRLVDRFLAGSQLLGMIFFLVPLELSILSSSALLGVSLSLYGVICLSIYQLSNRWAPIAIEKMMDLPGPILQFPVTVTYMSPGERKTLDLKHRQAILGLDRGVISFVDGLMVFQGAKSSFSIESKSLNPYSKNGVFRKPHSIGNTVSTKYSFAWREGDHWGEINITLYDSSKSQGKELRGRFLKEYSWFVAHPSNQSNEIVLPPIGPDPVTLKDAQRETRIWHLLAPLWVVNILALSELAIRTSNRELMNHIFVGTLSIVFIYVFQRYNEKALKRARREEVEYQQHLANEGSTATSLQPVSADLIRNTEETALNESLSQPVTLVRPLIEIEGPVNEHV